MHKHASILTIAGLSLLAAACSTNTKGSWSCSTPGSSSCAPISVIDGGQSNAGTNTKAAATRVEASGPLRWWESQPFVFSSEEAARREGDQVIRVVFAPWVDGQGDLHKRSEVMAVMRRGGWWMPTPTTVDASAQLSRLGRNAVEN